MQLLFSSHMLLFSSAKRPSIQIEYKALNEHELNDRYREIKEQAITWFHNVWGKSESKSREQIESNEEYIQIGFINDTPVTMFAIKPFFNEGFLIDGERPKGLELDMVYVEPSMRSLGLGSKIIEKAKQIAKNQQQDLLLEVFDYKLIKFYHSKGAELLERHQFEGQKTHLMRFN